MQSVLGAGYASLRLEVSRSWLAGPQWVCLVHSSGEDIRILVGGKTPAGPANPSISTTFEIGG